MAVKPPRGVKPNIEFPKVMLAPIAGVTDRATRDIARMHGCPLTFSELISARGIKERNRGSVQMIEECRDEHPLIVQIFGSEPDSIYDSIRMLDDMGVDGVNLNLGCPVKKSLQKRLRLRFNCISDPTWSMSYARCVEPLNDMCQ